MIQCDISESYWLDRSARGVVTPPQSPRLRSTPPDGPCKIRVEHPSCLGARLGRQTSLGALAGSGPFRTVQSPLQDWAVAGSGADVGVATTN